MVSRDEIEDVADNARLDLTGDEVDELTGEVEQILDSFAALDSIDTEGVEPSLHPIQHGDRTRTDEQEECLSQEDALRNAENTEDGYIQGPRSVE